MTSELRHDAASVGCTSEAALGYCLDPEYAPLSELLQQLGQGLGSDLHWATDTPYTYPKFIHGVFQRHILNFEVDRSRKFANVTMTPSLSTPQVESFQRSGSNKHSRDPEPESESVSCYSFLI